MDSGFAALLFLFVSAPLLNLSWLITEIVRSVKVFRRRRKAAVFLLPLMAAFFFLESLAIDLYIASHARM